ANPERLVGDHRDDGIRLGARRSVLLGGGLRHAASQEWALDESRQERHGHHLGGGGIVLPKHGDSRARGGGEAWMGSFRRGARGTGCWSVVWSHPSQLRS